MSEDPPPVIRVWRFRTREGSVRLGLVVPDDEASSLMADLRGCSIVADSMSEFLGMAARSIHAHNGHLGDILRQPWPHIPLSNLIRSAAHEADVFKASSLVLDAVAGSPVGEREDLLRSPERQIERDYLWSLATALDEHRDPFLSELASRIGTTSPALMDLLDPSQ